MQYISPSLSDKTGFASASVRPRSRLPSRQVEHLVLCQAMASSVLRSLPPPVRTNPELSAPKSRIAIFQKKRDVHKISARNSGPEMAAPVLWAPGILGFFLQEKTPMPIKFLLLGGGSGLFLEGGVGVPILFLWARGFFRILPVFQEPREGGTILTEMVAILPPGTKPIHK